MGKKEQKAFVRRYFCDIQKNVMGKIEDGVIPVSWGDGELKAYISLVAGMDDAVADQKKLMELENEVLMYAL